MKKLISKEDGKFLHIHKILGLSCLIHFIYRYLMFFKYGNFQFNSNYDLIFLLLHGFLSATSLIFHIPIKRNMAAPMIYPEFRQHNILFAFRCIICCLFHYFNIKFTEIIVILTLLIADYITIINKVDSVGNTTMRGMPFSKDIDVKQKQNITLQHSSSQVGATIFMMININTAFSPLFAIQISSLLMTLVRKNIIRSNHFHLIYSLTLISNFLILYTLSVKNIIFIATANYLFNYLRFSKRLNKYSCWGFIYFYKIVFYNVIPIIILDDILNCINPILTTNMIFSLISYNIFSSLKALLPLM